MDDLDSEWKRKGATLTDKTACKEFGLTPDDLNVALEAGALQWRETSIYGNPCLRLLRKHPVMPGALRMWADRSLWDAARGSGPDRSRPSR